MKIFALVNSSHKFYKSRLVWVYKTWLKHLDGHLVTTDIINETNPNINQKSFTTLDEHTSCSIKQWEGVKYIAKYYKGYDWYLLCDDDTFINHKKLYDFASKENPDISQMYGQSFRGAYPPKPTQLYLSGGAGMLVSRVALQKIARCDTPPKAPRKNNGPGENSDVKIGMIAELMGVKMNHSNLFHYTPLKKQKNKLEFMSNNISCHYMKGEQQLEAYNLIK
jgi:hypothetical protein